MSSATAPNRPPSAESGRSAVGALAAVLILQLGALALVVADIDLTAKVFQTGPHRLEILFAAQIIAVSLVMPDVAANVHRAILILAVACPLLQYAGHLAGRTPLDALLAWSLLILWLGALVCWRRIFGRTEMLRLFHMALTLWVLGMAALWYLVSEFQPSSIAGVIAEASPLLTSRPFLLFGIHALAAMGVLLWTRWCRMTE